MYFVEVSISALIVGGVYGYYDDHYFKAAGFQAAATALALYIPWNPFEAERFGNSLKCALLYTIGSMIDGEIDFKGNLMYNFLISAGAFYVGTMVAEGIQKKKSEYEMRTSKQESAQKIVQPVVSSVVGVETNTQIKPFSEEIVNTPIKAGKPILLKKLENLRWNECPVGSHIYSGDKICSKFEAAEIEGLNIYA
jgi:hypothetical protein